MSNDHGAERWKCELKKKMQKQKNEIWVKHYSSNHQILLVGEGNFSFSLSLARSFGSASNILASSLDSYDELIKKYKEAKSNLQNLEEMGASLLHGVDATIMQFHTDLTMRKFDRIVFNFPHAGFYGKEDNADLIQMHRDLVNGFFSNASCMLLPNGEIHVNHKTTAPFCSWNIQELASHNSMHLVERLDFNKEDYPGYENKRGSSSRCDESFPLGKCSTFKFKFYDATGRCQQFQETWIQMQQGSTSTYYSYYPQEGHLSNMEQISGRAPLPLPTNPRNQFFEMSRFPLETDPRNQFHWMFDGHVNHPTEMFGRGNYNLSSSLDTPGIHPVPEGWEYETLNTGWEW